MTESSRSEPAAKQARYRQGLKAELLEIKGTLEDLRGAILQLAERDHQTEHTEHSNAK